MTDPTRQFDPPAVHPHTAEQSRERIGAAKRRLRAATYTLHCFRTMPHYQAAPNLASMIADGERWVQECRAELEAELGRQLPPHIGDSAYFQATADRLADLRPVYEAALAKCRTNRKGQPNGGDVEAVEIAYSYAAGTADWGRVHPTDAKHYLKVLKRLAEQGPTIPPPPTEPDPNRLTHAKCQRLIAIHNPPNRSDRLAAEAACREWQWVGPVRIDYYGEIVHVTGNGRLFKTTTTALLAQPAEAR